MPRFLKYERLLAAGCLLLMVAVTSAQSLNERIEHARTLKDRVSSSNQSKAVMLGSLVFTEVTVQFQDTPARAAIDFLRTQLGIQIVGRYSDDRTGEGIDPDTPIMLNVHGQSALTVLEMILDQCAIDDDACTWQLRHGYVEVGTKKRLAASGAHETRYYPIRDLLVVPPRYDNASRLDLAGALSQSGGGNSGGRSGGSYGGGGGGEGGSASSGGSIISPPGDDPEGETEAERAERIRLIIMETIEPEAWEIAGGEWATIRYHRGVFIVRAPDFIHRQINGYPFPLRRPPLGNSTGQRPAWREAIP